MEHEIVTRRRLKPPGVRITWAPRPKKRAGARGPLPKLEARAGLATPEQYRSFTPPAVSPAMVVPRVLAWLLAALRFGLAIFVDRVRGRSSEARTAADLRAVLESMGPTAIKAGQRIAMRLDLLPLSYAAELSKIRDTAPPMPLDYAIERVEVATKGRLSDVFQSFDPTPIVSDSIACAYQAVLRSGAKVVVRVRRKEAPASFAAERVTMGWLLRRLAPLLPRHRLLINELERELPRLLLDDLDFIRTARLQRFFRKEAKASGLDFLTAAKVFIRMCGDDVMVSEFVAGVWLDEVIAAQDIDLRVMNIDPVLCGKRLLQAAWWGFFECSFFCELPATSRIVVRENGQLVFVGLGDTGVLGTRQKKLLYTALERLGLYDLEGAVQVLVQLLMPLPYIDVYEFNQKLVARMWGPLYAMNNPDSQPWERASTGLWLALFETTREYGVTVGLDLARMMQSACLYEHMATRLWPKIDLFREFARYRRQALTRANEASARARKRGGGASLASIAARPRRLLAGLPDLVGQLALWGQSIIENAPVKHIAHTQKGVYAVLQAIQAIAQVARVALLAAVLRGAWVFHLTGEVQARASVLYVLNHPLLLGAVLLIMSAAARRVLFRLEDVSQDERNKA